MKIVETLLFSQQRDDIVYFIASDKKGAALKFAKELKANINNLSNMPYKYKQSIYYENINIRDMAFKSYSIIYRINENKQQIEILEIFKKNIPKID